MMTIKMMMMTTIYDNGNDEGYIDKSQEYNDIKHCADSFCFAFICDNYLQISGFFREMLSSLKLPRLTMCC